ncbi:hydrolase [Clostridium chrysemydis]|uniref:hydrolase n=1 Tax=Clostridium chrysemydis TaxID=2665504 RepID=UPI001883B00C|nr:hydrolase [Clostridium chrysemydis]
MKREKFVPEFNGVLRSHMVRLPKVIRDCSGISIFGRRIKSILFSTDVAMIKNTDADAVIAVYPFTPQPKITEAIMIAADIPVFSGVGGGLTSGIRVINLALDAEFKGAMGVVVNQPTPNDIVKKIAETIDVPLIVTVVSEEEDIEARINSGASILNVSGGANTVKIVKKIRSIAPFFPIIATGGPTDETIKETIEAGANAITYTPRHSSEIMSDRMDIYREREEGN